MSSRKTGSTKANAKKVADAFNESVTDILT